MRGEVLPASRREFIGTTVSAAVAVAAGAPFIACAPAPLSLSFRTIADPDGWHPNLRLKGDWLIVEISDGRLSGFGEASHSMDDDRCREVTADLFNRHYQRFPLSLEALAENEGEIGRLSPDFITATAYSGLNQALYDLLAKREQVPVWRLFADRPGLEGIELYTTINRALQTRTPGEYSAIVAAAAAQGFGHVKCAPFEAVDGRDDAIGKSAAGLALLDRLRQEFPEMGIRVDFHERYVPEEFFALLPEFERLRLTWLEEPFAMGPAYSELRARTDIPIAAGELFWGSSRFQTIADEEWADVIMPDVKHVGGFGPLLQVLAMGAGRIEISPHNPSGPVSTAASLHAAALYPGTVRSLEYAFDRTQSRAATGEVIEDGRLLLTDRPGWGVEPV